jgi:glyoxylase-like metal-dependent hydrolase (beta-lactamase superfamily II)
MQIQAVFRGPQVAVGYLVYKRDGGDAMIVDAPLGSTASFVEMARQKNLRIIYVVNTHGHWDMIADNVPLTEATGAPLCAHAWDNARLANPGIAVEHLDEKVPDIKPSRPDRYLNEGDVLDVGGLQFRIMHTPGHSPGSICVYEPNAHAIFAGDLVARQAVGSFNMPGGNERSLETSLLKLAALPDNTTVFPAHGMATRIGEIRWLLDLARTS